MNPRDTASDSKLAHARREPAPSPLRTPKTTPTTSTPWTPDGERVSTPVVEVPPSIFSFSPADLKFKLPEKALRKRARDQAEPSTSTPAGPGPKRRRIYLQHRHTVGHLDFPVLPNPTSANQPPSPLFFSNHRRLRPQLPARLSSSEAGARMLSKTKGEDSQIRTVHLPRGTFSGSSPSGTSITARSGSDRISLPRTSPEIADRSYDPLRILSQVGIVELLEQDGRPTYIVDLKEAHNYTPGPLQVIFANSALRADPALLDLVTGGSGLSPTSQPRDTDRFGHYKGWLLGGGSYSSDSLDVCLPSFTFAGFSWSYSTIRKRLRVVSASVPTRASPSLSTSVADISMSSVPTSANSLPRSSAHTYPSASEPQDYFGNAAPPAVPAAPETPLIVDQNPPNNLPLNLPNNLPPNTVYMSAIEPPDPSKPTTIPGWSGRVFGSPHDITLHIDSNISFTNECVLSAAAAGNVDPFGSLTNIDSFSSNLSGSNNGYESPREIGFFDWTRLPLSEGLPKHIQFARSIDWSSTKLGPIEDWNPDLRQMCNLIMASPHPAAMYWGEDLVAVYNEAYVLLAGQKHPKLMGQSYADAWSEIWDEVKDVFENAKLTGQATMKVKCPSPFTSASFPYSFSALSFLLASFQALIICFVIRMTIVSLSNGAIIWKKLTFLGPLYPWLAVMVV